MRSEKVKRIADFKNGEKGKISGQILFAGETINAPLTGRRCVYYYVMVEEYRRSRSSANWHKIFEEEGMGDVEVDDGTGYAIIDTRFTMSHLVPDVKFHSGTFDDPPPKLEAYLSSRRIDGTTLLGFNKNLRYVEGILEKGETCVVSGEGQWNIAKDHHINIPAEQVLVITTDHAEHAKVYITDDPQAIDESVL